MNSGQTSYGQEIGSKNVEAIVLASGGLDSTACLAYCRAHQYKTEALFIEYGQASLVQERQAVRRVAQHYNTPLTAIEISGLGPFGSGFVPARNAVLLSLALSKVHGRNGIVLLGIHAGTSYVDCAGSFIEAIQHIFDIYSGGRLRVHCPFLNWTKPEIWEYCRRLNVPIPLTYSCENGGEIPCGACLSCKDREVLIERR